MPSPPTFPKKDAWLVSAGDLSAAVSVTEVRQHSRKCSISGKSVMDLEGFKNFEGLSAPLHPAFRGSDGTLSHAAISVLSAYNITAVRLKAE
jgi:hypothetical protein